MVRSLALAAALLAAAQPVWAAEPEVVGGQTALFAPEDTPGSVYAPLIPEARFTAMDLLNRVFPDLDRDGHYRQLLPVKVVQGASMPEIGAGYTQAPSDPALTMDSPSFAVVRDGRHAIAFVLGASVLVADWLLPAPAVGEAMFVQTDPASEPVIERAFAVRPGVAAALVVNPRGDASNGMARFALFTQGFDGLRAVYDGLTIRAYTRATSFCAREQHTQALSEVRPLRTRHDGYADIALGVTEVTTCEGARMAAVPDRRFAMVLKWDARTRRYGGGSAELDRQNRQAPEFVR